MSRPVGLHLDSQTQARILALLAQGLTVSAVAREVGVERSTVRRIRDRPPPDPAEPAEAQPSGPFRLGASPESRRIVQLEDEVRRLRGELRAAHRAALDEEAVREIIGSLARAAEEPPDWVIKPTKKRAGERTPEVPVCTWSDWHMGEVVSRAETNGVNAYDIGTAERRIRALVANIVSIATHHGPGRYPGIVVNLLGDIVSGGLHAELAKTDQEEVLPVLLRARDILVWAFEQMIAAFGQVYVPCAAGNHGRNTLKPEFKRYVYKNYDWLIYELLARHFAGRPEIRFDIRPSNEVRYRVFGQRYLAMHGDMLGVKGGDGIIGAIGPIMRGEVKTRGQAASSGRDYDVLVIGHWHQELWLPRAIVANALKGFDEFARLALRAIPSEPSQPLWFVHPRRGVTSRWNVRVEAPPERAGVEWVSWEGEVDAA